MWKWNFDGLRDNLFQTKAAFITSLNLRTIYWSLGKKRALEQISTCPYLGQVWQVIDLDLLLCTRFDLEHSKGIGTNQQMPSRLCTFSGTGCWFRSAALPKIQFGRCRLFLRIIFIQRPTNDRLLPPKMYKAFKLFWLSQQVSIARVALFPKASRSLQQQTLKHPMPVFVPARRTRHHDSCAGARPQELCRLRLPSGIAIWKWLTDDKQGLSDPHLNSAALPTSCWCGVWVLFRSLKMPTLRQAK